MGNGTGLQISHISSTLLSTTVGKSLLLTNVVCVPAITKKLLSISQLTKDNDVLVEFISNSYFIKDKQIKRIILSGTLCNGLYVLDSAHSSSLFSLQALHTSLLSADDWHSRLMHCSSSIVSTIRNSTDISMSPITSSFCSHCSKAKAHKLPFYPSISHASVPLHVIHTDLWGPSPVPSHNGHRFYVHFTDEYR
jgi:GAG-pre-integrase domain